MKFYEELAEMYVGDDVSPDFYAWVFPKYDHVGVGTGTVINRPAIKMVRVVGDASSLSLVAPVSVWFGLAWASPSLSSTAAALTSPLHPTPTPPRLDSTRKRSASARATRSRAGRSSRWRRTPSPSTPARAAWWGARSWWATRRAT